MNVHFDEVKNRNREILSKRCSKVAVVRTSPETVLEDIARAMDLAEYRDFISSEYLTHLKINISWHFYYPACSTTPWQLEGVTKKLLDDGFSKNKLLYTHNNTVVVDPELGHRNNHLLSVEKKYGIKTIYIHKPQVEWIPYRAKGETTALDGIYKNGIHIPYNFHGSNIIHLPTMKTHVFTVMTGAMKNAFGGLLNTKRHWTHSVIHQTLVDLLTVQYEIHQGVFAVMDAAIGGEGPGPRLMNPRIVNMILASGDQVAIDAVAAKIMGFDPMSLDFIRLAHEEGLGRGELSEIDVVGEDIKDLNLHFKGYRNTFASIGQKMIYHGPLKPLEKILLRTPLVPWSYIASVLYHDKFWYPLFGKRRVKKVLRETDWGRLFTKYGEDTD
ncbi:MAG: DUF362 domain-containing protein [bacterium]